MKKNYFLSLLVFTSIMSAQVAELKDINDGSSGSNPSGMIVFDGKIYFAADDGSGVNSGDTDYGKELWVSDGTAAGTTFVKDIKTGTSGSSPREFFIFNNQLYFTANDDIGANLWVTDGTNAGTVSAEIYPEVNESVQNPIELDGKVYMRGISTNGDTNDLLIFDGTSTAVNANSTANDESILSSMAALNGKLLMYANYAPDDATVDNELYEFDPATGVFTLIKDIDPGTANSSISNLTTIGTKVYFEADNDLWETDGTETGTIKVNTANSVSSVSNFHEWNGNLFFEGDDGTNDDQLYVLNPTADTLTNISTISGNNHDPADFVEYNGYLYYSGQDAADNDNHLFRTDGATIEQLDTIIKDIDDIVVYNNKLYFEGDNGTDGNELFTFNPATLSIDRAFENSVSIYPNPSTNFINVRGNFNEVANYKMYNIIGKNIKNGSLKNNVINHNLAPGIYLLKLISGDKTISKKIIVK